MTSPGPWTQLILVMAGGAVGAGLRFLIGNALMRQFGAAFPWGTLAVNTAGAFAAGYLLIWLQTQAGAALLRPLLVIGLLGGLTTFSALMVETLLLSRDGDGVRAALYLLLTLLLGLFAVVLGAALARPSITG